MAEEGNALLEEPRFSLRAVFADGFATLFRTAPTLLSISLIVALPFFVWLVIGGEALLLELGKPVRLDGQTRHVDPVKVRFALAIILVGLGTYAAICHAAFQDLIGAPVDILASLKHALVTWPRVNGVCVPLLLLGFVAVILLAVAGGLLAWAIHWSFGVALILLGLAGLAAITVQLAVLIPVLVIERAGPIECFRRSSALTAGHRWKIFALLLAVLGSETGAKLLLVAATPAIGPFAVALGNIALSGLFTAGNAVLTLVTYAHLRAIKEGAGADLFEVFE